jgi:hypothetical protein
VSGQWSLSACAQVARGVLFDAGVSDSKLSFHPRVPDEKKHVLERLYGELGFRGVVVTGGSSAGAPESDMACVYDNVLPGSGGRARESFVVSPRGLFWKNLTSTQSHFAAWPDVVAGSTDTGSKRRVKFRVRGQFTHESVDFYRGETALREALADLIETCAERCPRDDEEEEDSSVVVGGGTAASRGTKESATTGGRSMDISAPHFVRRLGPDAALRAVYGSFTADLERAADGEEDGSLPLRVNFPEGFPLEFKTLVIRDDATTTVAQGLEMLRESVPSQLWDKFFSEMGISEARRAESLGFFIASDQMWLDPGEFLGAYKGLRFLKKVDLRVYPEDRSGIKVGKGAPPTTPGSRSNQPGASAVRPVSPARRPPPARGSRRGPPGPPRASVVAAAPKASTAVSAPSASPSSPASQQRSPGDTSAAAEGLRAQVETLTRQLGTSEALLQASGEELDVVEGEKAKLEGRVDYFKQQVAQLRAENEQLRTEMARLERNLEAQSDRFAEGLQRLSTVARKSSEVPREVGAAASEAAIAADAPESTPEPSQQGEVAALQGEIDDIFAGFG